MLRCERLGFAEEIDASNELRSKQRALEALDTLIFEKFVSGEFTFEDRRQEKAKGISALSDHELIEQAFSEDDFAREFIRFELVRRDLLRRKFEVSSDFALKAPLQKITFNEASVGETKKMRRT